MNRLQMRSPTPKERAELVRRTRSGKMAWSQWARTVLPAADADALGTKIAQAQSADAPS